MLRHRLFSFASSSRRRISPISPLRRAFRTSRSCWDASDAAGGQAPQISTVQQAPSASSGARDAVIATLAGVVLVGIGGVAYHNFYKYDVLRKIDIAFRPGDDPILRLDNAARQRQGTLEDGDEESTAHLRRRDQAYIDRIVDGKEAGHYFLIMGPKGVGKSTMLVDAMRKNDADGVASFEAHEDPEVLRLRLGKCLNYEYSEDWAGGLFQRKDPREAGPLLDIERALNKLEKVAIRYAERRKRPLCLIINNCHLIHRDEEGYALLHAFQQRAEAWAQAKVMNMVFVTDDYWVWEKLRKNGTRMSIVHCDDLSEKEAIAAIRSHRPECSVQTAQSIYGLLGGRLSIINRLLRAKGDLIDEAKAIIATEQEWLLARRTLIPDHDDDVMDQQKESSCAWLLFQALVKQEDEAKARGETDSWISLADSHVIMTRTDFMSDLDHENMVRIDAQHRVRADSIMLLNAMRDVVSQSDFQEVLDATRSRVDDIESLHRTREIVIKDNDGVLPIAQSRR